MIVTASTVEDSRDLLSPTETEDIVDTNSTGATSTKKKKKKKKKNRNTNDNDKQEVEVETGGVEEEEETVAIVVVEEEEEGEKTVNVAVEEGEQQQVQEQQEEISAVVVRKEAQKPMSPAVSLLEHGASVAGEELNGSSIETVTENKEELVAKVKKTSSHTVVSSVMDSRKAWGGQAKKTDGPRIDSVIPYETLKSMRDGIDMTRKEEYLAADEFQAHFKQDIESFKKLPLWRQILLKKKVGLF